MVTVFDVATELLNRLGRIDPWRLQKLVYYCQAWSLALNGRAMFGERIEAWRYGPVVRPLYACHRQQYTVAASDLPAASAGVELCAEDRAVLDFVIERYAELGSDQLVELTHLEAPWASARNGLLPTEPSDAEISRTAMREFYSAQLQKERLARESGEAIYLTEQKFARLADMTVRAPKPSGGLVAAFARQPRLNK